MSAASGVTRDCAHTDCNLQGSLKPISRGYQRATVRSFLSTTTGNFGLDMVQHTANCQMIYEAKNNSG